MKDIIKKHLKDLKFTTGLKQFEEYSKEDAIRLVDSLNDLFLNYRWMTDERCDLIMRFGMLGEYGEFVRINERTINGWIQKYFSQNQNKISTEIQYHNNESVKDVSEDEKEYWLEVGRQNFRDKLELAKSRGYIPHLSEWGAYWYGKFVDKGILIESNYQVESMQGDIKKELRSVGKWIDEITVKAKLSERIWQLFILQKIKENFDFEPYLK